MSPSLVIQCTIYIEIIFNCFDRSCLQPFVVAFQLRVDYFKLYDMKLWWCIMYCWQNISSVGMKKALFINVIPCKFCKAMALWSTDVIVTFSTWLLKFKLLSIVTPTSLNELTSSIRSFAMVMFGVSGGLLGLKTMDLAMLVMMVRWFSVLQLEHHLQQIWDLI